MVLIADMGNSNVVLAAYGEDGRVVFSRRVLTEHSWDVQRYILELQSALPHGAQFADVALCSVVPALTDTVRQALACVCGRTPLLLNCHGNTGIGIPIGNPEELGADLLAAAMAAKAAYPLPALVIQLGTATTFTMQDAKGDILGVSIAPGALLSLEALLGRASQLCRAALQAPEVVLGSTTLQSLRSGVVLGTACMLDGMIDRVEAERGPAKSLLLAGGLAPMVQPFCRHPLTHVPNLVPDGVYEYWKRNRDVAR